MANVQSAYSIAEMDNAIGQVPSKADISYVDSKVAAIKSGTKLYKHTILADLYIGSEASSNRTLYVVSTRSDIYTTTIHLDGVNILKCKLDDGSEIVALTTGQGTLIYHNNLTEIVFIDTIISDTVTEL